VTTSDELVKQLLAWAPYVWTALTGLAGVLIWLVPRLLAEGGKRAADAAQRDLASDERRRLRADLDEHVATMHEALMQMARLAERVAAAERDLRRHSDRARAHSGRLYGRVVVPAHRLPRVRDSEPEG